MQEAAFRKALSQRLGDLSINSYIAYARRVERVIGIDLDDCDLVDDEIEAILRRLQEADVSANSVNNSRSALRAYAAFRTAAAPTPITGCARQPPGSGVVPTPFLNEQVRQGSTGQLLDLYGQIMEELHNRRIVRTGNSPVGDYAELLFSKAFEWRLSENSTSGHDATDAHDLRYQIKGRRLANGKASRQLGALRNLDQKNFNFLAAVLFDSRFRIEKAVIVPHDLVRVYARRSDHTNSWTLILDNRLTREPAVRDVTEKLRDMASSI